MFWISSQRAFGGLVWLWCVRCYVSVVCDASWEVTGPGKSTKLDLLTPHRLKPLQPHLIHLSFSRPTEFGEIGRVLGS